MQRLEHALNASRSANSKLRASLDSMTTAQMQQMTSSTSCETHGCGALRVENARLRKYNSDLKRSLQQCETQLAQLTRDLELWNQSRELARAEAAASTSPSRDCGSNVASGHNSPASPPPSTHLPSPSPSPSSSPLPASSPNPVLTSSLFDSSATSPFAFSLLRVRCALALARLQVRHQSELDHLLPYKLHHLSLQNGVDDLETQLETERQLRHADAAELERCHAQIAQLQQEQETLQTVMARLAEQLAKHVGSAGMSVSMASPVKTKPSSGGGGGGKEIETPLSPNAPVPPYATPSKATPPAAAVTIGPLSPPNGGGGQSAAGGGGGSSGWGLGWMFGGGSKTQRQNEAPTR